MNWRANMKQNRILHVFQQNRTSHEPIAQELVRITSIWAFISITFVSRTGIRTEI